MIRETEKCGSSFILVNQSIVAESLPQYGGRVPVSAYSFSLFLMKKCMEIGGANTLAKTLLTQQDHAELVADYFINDSAVLLLISRKD